MKSQTVTVLCGGPGLTLPEKSPIVYQVLNQDNRKSPCESYQYALNDLKQFGQPDVLIYIHDDVTIHNPRWSEAVMAIFEETPNCVCVGLGGAPSLGHHDLYKRPYHLPDMARGGYVSNQTDWQIHGERETGAKRVAVVDAFFMAVRRDFLEQVGGWPVDHITHHCLDLWLGCEAARRKKEVWMLGVECTHHGGGTSVRDTYKQAKWLQGGTLESDHQLPHAWLYDEYRDVLPIEVGPR